MEHTDAHLLGAVRELDPLKSDINLLIRNLQFHTFMLFEVQNYIFYIIKLSHMPEGKSEYYVLNLWKHKPLNVNEKIPMLMQYPGDFQDLSEKKKKK